MVLIKKNFLDNAIYSFVSLLLCLLPIFLVIGPAPSDICISLMSILFLYLSIKYKLINFYNNKYFKTFLIFYFFILLSSLFSNHLLLSLESSLFYFRFALFSLCVVFLIEMNKSIIQYFFFSLLITLSVIILDGYLQFFTGSNLIGLERPNEFRLTGFFDEERILGSYVARLTPLILALYVYHNFSSKLKLTLLYLFLIIADVLVYFSGERTSFFLISLATLMFLMSVSSYRKIRLVAFLTSIIIIISTNFFFPNVKERMIDRALNSTNILNDEPNVVFSESHQSLYSSAIKIFNENAIIGSGPKTFRIECKNFIENINSCSTHPHNTYLQLLSETGIIGFIIVMAVFLLISYKLLKNSYYVNFGYKKKVNNHSDYQICLLIAIFLSLWPLSPSFSFFNNYISIIYFLPVGFWLHATNAIDFKNK